MLLTGNLYIPPGRALWQAAKPTFIPHIRRWGAYHHVMEASSPRIMSVCSGNICRSPSMEVVIRHYFPGVDHGSSGTGNWHVGQGASPEAVATWEDRGYQHDHRAQQFHPGFFEEFDLILVADSGHMKAVRALAPNDDALAKIHYLREFDLEADGDEDLADPYYGTRKDYEEVFDIIERSVGELHRRLQENL